MIFRRHLRLLDPLARSAVAGLAAFVVFALAILSASPTAHAWIHVCEDHDDHERGATTDHPDHVCAVTLAQQGFCDTTPVLLRAGAPAEFVARCVLIPHAVRWTAPEHWLQPAQAPPMR